MILKHEILALLNNEDKMWYRYYLMIIINKLFFLRTDVGLMDPAWWQKSFNATTIRDINEEISCSN